MMDRAVITEVEDKWSWEAFDAEGNVLLEGVNDSETDAIKAIGEAFPNQGSITVEHVT